MSYKINTSCASSESDNNNCVSYINPYRLCLSIKWLYNESLSKRLDYFSQSCISLTKNILTLIFNNVP